MKKVENYDPDVSCGRFNEAEKYANDYISEFLPKKGSIWSKRYKYTPRIENPIGSNAYFREIFFTQNNTHFEAKTVSFDLFPEGWVIITDKDGNHMKIYQTVEEIFKTIIQSYKDLI